MRRELALHDQGKVSSYDIPTDYAMPRLVTNYVRVFANPNGAGGVKTRGSPGAKKPQRGTVRLLLIVSHGDPTDEVSVQH